VYRKRRFCEDLVAGEEVQEVFCVGTAERKMGRNGPFLRLSFLDRTGSLAGVAWDDVDRLAEVLEAGAYARVSGVVEEYRGERQLKVTAARSVERPIDPAQYLPRAPVPGEESVAAIEVLVETMGDGPLRELARAFLGDPEARRAFADAPAAKVNHHAYVGGLAEHTRSVMELCAAAAGHYPRVDRDLLLAGALFHDVGKTRELAVEPGFPYTVEGNLLGHIAIGFEIVRERARRIEGLSVERVTDLGHLILSHQGELEWGSPVRPVTLEALILHHVDNLDSKVGTALHHLEGVEEGPSEWVRSLGRRLFRRGPIEPADEGPAPAEPGRDADGDPSLPLFEGPADQEGDIP